jgi:Fe-S cluster assembly iron-binding protein IscA
MDITVTEEAIRELKRIAEVENKSPRVRLALKGGGCNGFTIVMCYTKWPHDEDRDLTFSKDGIEFMDS